MTTIETQRLVLRRLQPNDTDVYYARIYADPDVMGTLPGKKPIAREAFDVRIPMFMTQHWDEHGFGPWAVLRKVDNEFIGHCGLKYWPGSTDVEVFYALGKAYWGHGLATEAARASIRYGFEVLGLERVIAAALVEDCASRRVLEKLGMHYTGATRWNDLEIAQYMLEQAELIDASPTPGATDVR